MFVGMAMSVVVNVDLGGVNLGTGKFEQGTEITGANEVLAAVDDPRDDRDDKDDTQNDNGVIHVSPGHRKLRREKEENGGERSEAKTNDIADRTEDRAQSECGLREGRRPEDASSTDENKEN